MSEIAIRVQNVSKCFRLGEVERYRTLRDTLTRVGRRFLGREASSAPVHRHSSKDNEFWALKDISFDVKHGDVVGIIGRNGAGKSTLLKILSRITEPTSGRAELNGRVGSLLEVGTGFHPELTGRENIYLNGAILGMTRVEIKAKFDEIVAFSEIEKFLDTPVKRYSSGMYVRLAFAVAAHLEPEILIVDEVLAVGDAAFQSKCLGRISAVAREGRTVLFVSHNMAAVQDLCSSAILLAGGQVQKIGAVAETIRAYLDSGGKDELQPASGPLKYVRVAQLEEGIVVEADWSHSHPLRLPSLGFVIYDYMGTPIAGANPWLVGVDRAEVSSRGGRIRATLTEPRLLDGKYYLSVWFGDGQEDFVNFPKCISFDVSGMAGPRQYPTSLVGCVAARCDYQFSPQAPSENPMTSRWASKGPDARTEPQAAI